jgi:hypothetical protein
MGRQSLAEQIFNEYKEEEPGKNTLLILYDFPDMKPTDARAPLNGMYLLTLFYFLYLIFSRALTIPLNAIYIFPTT